MQLKSYSPPLDWSHNGDNRHTAFTYTHELRVWQVAPEQWQFSVSDLCGKAVADGTQPTLLLALGQAEVREELANDRQLA